MSYKNLIFSWILVNTIAPAIGWLIGTYFAPYFGSPGLFTLNTFVLSLTLAITIGLAQGLVIEKWIKRKQWIFVSTLSWTIGFPSSFVIAFIVGLSLSLGLFLAYLVAGIFMGSLIGIPQWLLLRTVYYRANLWLITNIFSYATGYLMLGNTIVSSSNNNISERISTALLLSLFGLLTGAITGKNLIEIVKRPK